MLTVDSAEDGLALVLTPVKTDGVFSEQIPLAAVQLLQETPQGDLETPLLADATLRYPDVSTVPPVTVPRRDLVGLADLEDFRLESLAVDAESGGLKLRFDGIAGEVRSVDGAFRTDRRLTLFERVRHSSRFSLLGVAAVWLLTTSWGVYSAWRHLPERASPVRKRRRRHHRGH